MWRFPWPVAPVDVPGPVPRSTAPGPSMTGTSAQWSRARGPSSARGVRRSARPEERGRGFRSGVVSKPSLRVRINSSPASGVSGCIRDLRPQRVIGLHSSPGARRFRWGPGVCDGRDSPPDPEAGEHAARTSPFAAGEEPRMSTIHLTESTTSTPEHRPHVHRLQSVGRPVKGLAVTGADGLDEPVQDVPFVPAIRQARRASVELRVDIHVIASSPGPRPSRRRPLPASPGTLGPGSGPCGRCQRQLGLPAALC